MSLSLYNALAPLVGENILADTTDLLREKYYEDWRLSVDPEERERIFIKTQVIEELLGEFSSIIDKYRETDDDG